jgi:hypothetical protein
VLQETFLAAWRGAVSYRAQGACGGWLWGIARRQAALLLRRRGPALAALPEDVVPGDPAAGDASDAMVVRTDRVDALISGSRAAAGLRLVRLHLANRRIAPAVLGLAACGAVLRVALAWHWGPQAGNGALQIPVLLEGGAAAVIAVTSYSPFGEVERVTGRWLPWLRFGVAAVLTAVAIGVLAAASTSAGLAGGVFRLARDVAGMTGVGLLSAAVLGGLLAWIGPMAYLVVSEIALLQAWTSPWTWAARAPDDRGALVCAGVTFVIGLVIVAIRGPRDPLGD